MFVYLVLKTHLVVIRTYPGSLPKDHSWQTWRTNTWSAGNQIWVGYMQHRHLSHCLSGPLLLLLKTGCEDQTVATMLW